MPIINTVREGVYNVEHNNAGIEVTAECQKHNNMNIATVGNRMPRGDSGDGNWSRECEMFVCMMDAGWLWMNA